MLHKAFFFCLFLCALGTLLANFSAALPEKVQQCCNATVW